MATAGLAVSLQIFFYSKRAICICHIFHRRNWLKTISRSTTWLFAKAKRHSKQTKKPLPRGLISFSPFSLSNQKWLLSCCPKKALKNFFQRSSFQYGNTCRG